MIIDPSVQIAIVSTIGTALLALIGIFGTVINTKMNRAEKANVATHVNLDEIKRLTNSNLSETNARLDRANDQIKLLFEKLNMQQEQSKKELVEEMRAPTTVPVLQAVKEVASALKADVPEEAVVAQINGEKT